MTAYYLSDEHLAAIILLIVYFGFSLARSRDFHKGHSGGRLHRRGCAGKAEACKAAAQPHPKGLPWNFVNHVSEVHTGGPVHTCLQALDHTTLPLHYLSIPHCPCNTSHYHIALALPLQYLSLHCVALPLHCPSPSPTTSHCPSSPCVRREPSQTHYLQKLLQPQIGRRAAPMAS